MVAVDYLQLLDIDEKKNNREQEISSISKQLKALAKELEIPVLAISQLNRAPDTRADGRPHLSDLRESGSLEQDADVVLLLWREAYYQKKKEGTPLSPRVILEVAKQRNGRTGNVNLLFQGQYLRFVNASNRAAVGDQQPLSAESQAPAAVAGKQSPPSDGMTKVPGTDVLQGSGEEGDSDIPF